MEADLLDELSRSIFRERMLDTIFGTGHWLPEGEFQSALKAALPVGESKLPAELVDAVVERYTEYLIQSRAVLHLRKDGVRTIQRAENANADS